MHRIQVQLTEAQEKMLKQLATLRGCSISALIREGVDEITAPHQRRRAQARARGLRLIGVLRDKPDVARRHDEYLADVADAPNRS